MHQGKRVAIYARVSTDDQCTDTPTPRVAGVADRAGWYIIEEVHRPCRQWSEGPGQAACVRPTPESRVKAGIARAKASGKVLGRPRVAEEIEERIRALRTNGRGMISIARELRVGGGTVQRVLKSEKQRCPA